MSGRAPEQGVVRPAPFFDQGIFLLHLNRGKEEMRRGRYDTARKELEDARRLRPQDADVLASLALTLFHLGHLDEAEALTREILKKNAEAVPLLFNLGLILLKGGRLAEARETLEKVLALSPGHRKAHLTLGLALQRLGDGARARTHFRLAGADRAAGAEEDDTVTRTARAAARRDAAEAAGSAETPPVKPERFEDAGDTHPLGVPALAAPEAAPPQAPETAPIAPLPAAPAPAAKVVEASGPDRMGALAIVDGGFVEANVEAGVFVRRGVVSGRRGAPVFETDASLRSPLRELLFRASGHGTLLLVEKGRRPHLGKLSGEFLSVDPSRLLAFDAGLVFREDPAFEFRRAIPMPFLKLYGEGAVAFAVATSPARFEVSASDPLTLSAASVVAYGGGAAPQLLENADPLSEMGGGPVLRFVGSGFVLAEA